MKALLALLAGFAIAWLLFDGGRSTPKPIGSEHQRASGELLHVPVVTASVSDRASHPTLLGSNGSDVSEVIGVTAPSLPPVTPLPPPPPEVLRAVVTISGSSGAGTGFIGRFRGQRFIVTNQHVLGAGTALSIRTSTGVALVPQRILAATDADVALITCTSFPSTIVDLEVASLHDLELRKDDPVMVAGNSQGDGVITQTPGGLIAVGPQRVEVNNPVYGGNSGSPIVHLPSQKVIGVLTEAEIVKLDAFGKASFRSKDSAIKSEIRYFGHRVDSVQKWVDLNWAQFHATEAAIKLSRTELDCIFAYFTVGTGYKSFRALHVAHNNAGVIYFNQSYSPQDKTEVYNRFLRDVDGFAKRTKTRVASQSPYFSQKDAIDRIARMADLISQATEIAKRDSDLAAILLVRGG